MHARYRVIPIVAMLSTLLAACAPSTPATPGASSTGSQAPASTSSGAPRTITVGMDEEVKNLWEAIQLGGGSGVRELADIFNQHLVAITADGSPAPRLLSELPAFDKGTWKILPDGKMETTYKLRNDAYWHDGTRFTAADVAFSLQVNKDPEISNSNQDAMRLVDRWQVLDPTTVVVTWNEAYPFPDRMEHRDLYTLPAHLLEASYIQGPKETFLTQTYFNADYVGLGPFRIARWESGSHIDFAAFDHYFLGRPKLDSIRVQFIPDKNTMVANLNARAIQVMMTLGQVPEFDAMLALKRDWEASGYGTVLMDPISYRFIEPQKYHNPTPADLKNPRVRQALMLAVDREALTRANFGEFGIVADSWVHPSFGNFKQLEDAIVKQPFDQRRARQMLEDAGWRAGGDGVLQKDGQRFAMTMRDTDGETDSVIIAANWKEIGVIGSYERRTPAALRDREDRATFSGVDVGSNPMGPAAVARRFSTSNLPTAENRWVGTNRGGYANPAWDDLEKRYLSAIEEKTRLDVERDMLRIMVTEFPVLPMFFRNDLVPVGGGLKGPVPNVGVAHRGFILHTWNVHEWEIK